jgi:methylglutaconyl-CoA hydratase
MEAKSLVRHLGARIDRETISETIGRLADVWEGPEAIEGIEAFFGKLKPAWATG